MQQLALRKWIKYSMNFFQIPHKHVLWGKTSKGKDITTGTFTGISFQQAAKDHYLCAISAQTGDRQFSLGRLPLQHQSLPVELNGLSHWINHLQNTLPSNSGTRISGHWVVFGALRTSMPQADLLWSVNVWCTHIAVVPLQLFRMGRLEKKNWALTVPDFSPGRPSLLGSIYGL